MKRFRFRFETLESVRQAQEQRALQLLAEAQRAHRDAQDNKRQLQDKLQEALKRRERLGEQAVQAFEFQTETDFIYGTKQRIYQAEQAIARADRSVNKALKFYLSAKKNLKAMEVLREKDYKDFIINKNRREQKEIDDIIVMRKGYLTNNKNNDDND